MFKTVLFFVFVFDLIAEEKKMIAVIYLSLVNILLLQKAHVAKGKLDS